MKTKNSQLTIVNVRLPLEDEQQLYTLRIKDGVWAAIEKQAEAVPAGKYISLDAPHAIYAGQLDAEGKAALPGMVDAHMHLDKAFSLPKVGNVSGTLGEAIANYALQAPSFTKEEIMERMMKTALQSISFGTTAMRTHIDMHVDAGSRVALQSIEAALELKEKLRPYAELQVFPMLPYRSGSGKEMELMEEALAMGVTGIGGAPHISPEPERNVDRIFALADRYGCPIDLHTDETDDPDKRTVLYIAEKTRQYGFQGRVTVDHLCSLASMTPAMARGAIQRMAEAKLNAVTLPAANLYLQGRGDLLAVRRGVTRVREIAGAGVPIAAASDNIHDPFHPFGRGDLLHIALLTAYGAHMGAPEDLRTLLRMITEIPASILGLSDYGMASGRPADFILFDARTPEELFTMLTERRWIYRAGGWLKAAAPVSVWEVPELEVEWAQSRRAGLTLG